MSSSERRGKRAEREERRGKQAERDETRETGGERREKSEERREKREERREKREERREKREDIQKKTARDPLMGFFEQQQLNSQGLREVSGLAGWARKGLVPKREEG